jgi:hypothetical protein
MQLQLDHYNGRRVESVESTGEDAWDWGVIFEGGAVVKNKDKRRTALPTAIVGQALAKVEYNEDDTQMIFGNAVNDQFVESVRVVLTPTQYTIADPANPVASEEETYPQALASEPTPTPQQEEMMNPEEEIAAEETPQEEIPLPEFPVPPTPEHEPVEEEAEEEETADEED